MTAGNWPPKKSPFFSNLHFPALTIWSDGCQSARGQLSRENYFPQSPFPTEDLVSRDGFGHIPSCSAYHEQDWQPYPVDPYSCYCTSDSLPCLHTTLILMEVAFENADVKQDPLGNIVASYCCTMEVLVRFPPYSRDLRLGEIFSSGKHTTVLTIVCSVCAVAGKIGQENSWRFVALTAVRRKPSCA